MVEANTDPAVVTARIERETKAAAEERRLEALASRTDHLERAGQPAPAALAVESVPATPPPPPPDPAASFRRARLGVVAVIALVLLLLWIRQRRAAHNS